MSWTPTRQEALSCSSAGGHRGSRPLMSSPSTGTPRSSWRSKESLAVSPEPRNTKTSTLTWGATGSSPNRRPSRRCGAEVLLSDFLLGPGCPGSFLKESSSLPLQGGQRPDRAGSPRKSLDRPQLPLRRTGFPISAGGNLRAAGLEPFREVPLPDLLQDIHREGVGIPCTELKAEWAVSGSRASRSGRPY